MIPNSREGNLTKFATIRYIYCVCSSDSRRNMETVSQVLSMYLNGRQQFTGICEVRYSRSLTE